MGILGPGAVVYKDTFHSLCFVLYWLKTTGHYLLAHAVMIGRTALTVWGTIEYSFPFIAIPLFTIGLPFSAEGESFMKIPSSIWMQGAMGVVCAGLFILIKSNIIAHGSAELHSSGRCASRCLYAPPRITPTDICISADYTIRLIHMKVLTFMVAEWGGYIPFWSWALTSIIVTAVFTYLKVLIKI